MTFRRRARNSPMRIIRSLIMIAMVAWVRVFFILIPWEFVFFFLDTNREITLNRLRVRLG